MIIEKHSSGITPFHIMGFFFTLLGMLGCYLITVGQFECSRIKGICSFNSRHIWEKEYVQDSTIPIYDIYRAVVESHHDHDHDIMYSVVLKTSSVDRKLFNSSSSSYSSHEKLANQINNFLHSNQDSLILKEPIFWLFIPFIFVVVGLCMFIPFDKMRQVYSVQNLKKMHYNSSSKL